VISMSEISNQLKSQSLGDVTPEAFKQVGGRVFPDASAFDGLTDLVAIVEAYRATHLPSYGAVIPSTGGGFNVAPASLNDSESLVEALENEVYQIQAISIDYVGTGTGDFELYLGDTLLGKGTAFTGDPQPLESMTNFHIFPLYVSLGQTLRVIQTAGDTGSLKVIGSLVQTCL